jgi:hypothetical protein
MWLHQRQTTGLTDRLVLIHVKIISEWAVQEPPARFVAPQLGKKANAKGGSAPRILTTHNTSAPNITRSEPKDKTLQLPKRPLEVIINNNPVMHPRRLRILQFSPSPSQPRPHTPLVLSATPPQPRLQHSKTRQLNKNKPRPNPRVPLQLPNPLHLNIQQDHQPFSHLVNNRLLAGAVQIAVELRILDERILRGERLELLPRDEVVGRALDLAGARLAGCVRDGCCEGFWVCVEQSLDECAFADA